MSQTTPITIHCDPETGLCTIPVNENPATPEWSTKEEIVYIGDPMCSWCWGISPQLNALKRYSESKGMPFRIIMGGLRPGGGDEWNEEFKSFLKKHWKLVTERSGQPFGYEIFNREEFDYDTEPACRAVVAARTLSPLKAVRFYELVQHYFYVKNKDPKELSFYEPICDRLDMNYQQFSELFLSEEIQYATRQDFMEAQSWGVKGFPSVIYKKGGELHLIARGYSTFEEMTSIMDKIDSEN